MGGIPPHPSEYKKRPAPPPCSFRVEHHKKVFFSFLEEIGRAQIRKARNIFLWCPPRLCEAVAGLIHSFSFRSKKVRAKCIITAPESNRHQF
ncbi:hypothetical protein A3E62_00635 [Candidatus Giovannonibacteria bacterium RIFCSPHIGHO2_12_FULL_44_29]|nr:MAG: hypothetical protein A3E62_00635 [Candidatus Giovannonibacteria bacterium RIFCSPHIGHO2_12_FULL_44_29]